MVLKTRGIAKQSKNVFFTFSSRLSSKFGFSLAEVLIALGVIGVIASMTLPSLLNTIRDRELKEAWKQTYSIVAQASNAMMSDVGGDLKDTAYNACIMYLNVVQPKMDFFASYYKTTRVIMQSNYDCGNLNSSMMKTYGAASSPIHKPDGSLDPFTNWLGNGIVLNNGAFLFYLVRGGGASPPRLGGKVYSILVDVNGAKKPNTWSKDFFQINVARYGIFPNGIDTTGGMYPCDATNYSNCGAWILQNPDYEVPW